MADGAKKKVSVSRSPARLHNPVTVLGRVQNGTAVCSSLTDTDYTNSNVRVLCKKHTVTCILLMQQHRALAD